MPSQAIINTIEWGLAESRPMIGLSWKLLGQRNTRELSMCREACTMLVYRHKALLGFPGDKPRSNAVSANYALDSRLNSFCYHTSNLARCVTRCVLMPFIWIYFYSLILCFFFLDGGFIRWWWSYLLVIIPILSTFIYF